MKYLGLSLDDEWSFRGHFAAVTKKAGARANMLALLLTNIGEPSDKVRRLYANTVCDVIFYGAPVWAGELAADNKSQAMCPLSYDLPPTGSPATTAP